MKRLKKIFPIILIILALSIVAFAVYSKNTEEPAPISKEVMSKINFLIYYPNNEETWTTDDSKTEFESESGVLIMNSSNGSASIVLSQQSAPDVFNDVPDQYQRMLNSLNQHTEILTSFGTITITRPAELNGGQSAVGNLNGTLLFAKPDKDLNDAEWKEFFKSMEVIR